MEPGGGYATFNGRVCGALDAPGLGLGLTSGPMSCRQSPTDRPEQLIPAENYEGRRRHQNRVAQRRYRM